MNYNDLVPEAEQTTICPYNKAHVVLNFRFNNHLIKCRKSYTGEELETCPFNSSHKIPKPEFYYHKKTCVDRKNILNYLQGNQAEQPKEKKTDKEWDKDENSDTKDAKLKLLRKPFDVDSSNGNAVDLDELENNDNNGERHGCGDESDGSTNVNADTRSYDPMAHLYKSINSNKKPNTDDSDRHDGNDQTSNHENVDGNPKKVLRDWSDDEDDIPTTTTSSYAKRYEASQNDDRSYRERSSDSFRSNRSNFRQNKNSSKFSRNHSNSPHSSGSRYSPYNRSESRQFRGVSRESNSNASTSSRSYQNRHNRSFSREGSRSNERFGDRESSGSRGSSKCRDFRDSRSREPSRSRESFGGYNKNRSGHDRRNSNSFNGNKQNDSHWRHQKQSNRRFQKSNFDSYNNNYSNVSENSQNYTKDPQIENDNFSQHQTIADDQQTVKLHDWSDEEDDVPESNQNLPQNSSNFNSSPENSNNIESYVSASHPQEPKKKILRDWSDEEDDIAPCSENNFENSTSASHPQETEKKKLRDWSDDEDDIAPQSACRSNGFDDTSRRRWDDNANDIGYADKVPITKSKRSRRFISDRPSDEEILERFAKSTNYKDFLSVDSWFDKQYRNMTNKNVEICDLFNMCGN